MRITDQEARLLKESVWEHLPGADVYLFGSRADDTKRGGDIDVLVIGKRRLDPLERARIKRRFFRRFGEQKLDIVSFERGESAAFREVAEEHAIAL